MMLCFPPNSLFLHNSPNRTFNKEREHSPENVQRKSEESAVHLSSNTPPGIFCRLSQFSTKNSKYLSLAPTRPLSKVKNEHVS